MPIEYNPKPLGYPPDWEWGGRLDGIAEKYAMQLTNMPGLLYLLNRYVFADIKQFFIAAVKEAAEDRESEDKIKMLWPEAHCAPMGESAQFPDYYIIRADRQEWSRTLAAGATPKYAWDNAVKMLEDGKLG